MRVGKQTIGDLVLSVGIAYQTVKDLCIQSGEGRHGRLTVVLEVAESVTAAYELIVLFQCKPKDYEKYVLNENKILLLF